VVGFAGIIAPVPNKEGAMAKSKRAIRRVILCRLFERLEGEYAFAWPRKAFVDGNLSAHVIDGILAFKSDPQLEELRRALERLEDDTYGICISCKGQISQHLLDSDPARRVCFACEKEFRHVTTNMFESHLPL
jgi:hypothetical protein